MNLKEVWDGLTARQKVALGPFVTSVIIGIVIYYFKEIFPNAPIDWLYVILSLTVTTAIFWDRIVTYSNETEIKRSLKMIERQNNDIEIFKRTEAAITWFVKNIDGIRDVKNTVYRPSNIAINDKFLVAVREVLKNPCEWVDICFAGEEEKIREFRKTIANGTDRGKHKPVMLPSVLPLIQVMIITYENADRTVLFGWPAPGSGSNSPVLKSSNQGIVDYFENYFDLLAKLTVPIPNLDPPDILIPKKPFFQLLGSRKIDYGPKK